jgi:hypothetical protein
MQSGRIIADGEPRPILADQDLLASARLEPRRSTTNVPATLHHLKG